MTTRKEQFKRLVDNYYSAGDRREWDATTQAEKALKDFGAVMQGNQWVDTKAEPDSVVIYVLDGGETPGHLNEHDRRYRFNAYRLTQRAGELACEQHADSMGYGAITWLRHDDDKSVGYVDTIISYSVTRTVVSDEIED